jgi:Uri superfamily endonuclease
LKKGETENQKGWHVQYLEEKTETTTQKSITPAKAEAYTPKAVSISEQTGSKLTGLS